MIGSSHSQLLGSAFIHGHHQLKESEEVPHPSPDDIPNPENLAAIIIPPGANPRQLTTLDLSVETDAGKRVCQQIMIDLGNFWLGKPVDYLALYTRN